MTATNHPARERALDRLLRIEEAGAFVSRVSGDEFDVDDAREERQANEYVAGVTRQRRWLDFLISEFYDDDDARLEPALRQVLRIGLYDLLLLETPRHAAVNEAVELAKRRVRPQAAGLVNAILRTADRRRDALPQPASGRKVRDLAVRYSQPNWLVRRWLHRLGDEQATELLAAANRRPVYCLRANTLRLEPWELGARLDELGVEWAWSAYLDDFVRVRQLQPILRAGLLADGSCAVQDEAAALVVRVLDPQPGETIVDAAAAPGGKSVYAAIRMRNQGRVLAYDVHPGRLDLVRQSAAAHGATIIESEAADVCALAQRSEPPRGDRVLVDAPCSGLGVLAKRADLRWRRTEEDIIELCGLQDRLLDAAAGLVVAGGLLVYSTCTTEPDENEERVAAFLQRHPGFAPEPVDGAVPDEMVTAEGYFLALPHRHGTDGAFGARLRRRRSSAPWTVVDPGGVAG